MINSFFAFAISNPFHLSRNTHRLYKRTLRVYNSTVTIVYSKCFAVDIHTSQPSDQRFTGFSFYSSSLECPSRRTWTFSKELCNNSDSATTYFQLCGVPYAFSVRLGTITQDVATIVTEKYTFLFCFRVIFSQRSLFAVYFTCLWICRIAGHVAGIPAIWRCFMIALNLLDIHHIQVVQHNVFWHYCLCLHESTLCTTLGVCVWEKAEVRLISRTTPMKGERIQYVGWCLVVGHCASSSVCLLFIFFAPFSTCLLITPGTRHGHSSFDNRISIYSFLHYYNLSLYYIQSWKRSYVPTNIKQGSFPPICHSPFNRCSIFKK